MKLVIVTGASTGIGFETVVRLAEEGYQVLACVRREVDLVPLKERSPRIHGALLDVAQPATIQQAVQALSRLLNEAEEVSLVNNAGIAVGGPLEAVGLQEMRRLFDVNVFGLLEVTQAFMPWIRKTKGRLINMSSVSGLSTSPFLGPYSASKYAVEAMSDAFRRELISHDVKVIVIEPGPIATPIWQKSLANKKQIEAGLRQECLPVYRDEFEVFEKYVERTARQALPVSKVADAVIDAVKMVDPPTRILVVSLKDRIRTLIAHWMPDKVLDGAIRKALSSAKN